MKYTVYKITNKVTNKTYIGKHQTQNLEDNYMGSGKYISRAIKKYRVENFTKEILFVFDNEQDMNDKETELVNEEYLNSGMTYNLCPGGQGGFGYINQNISPEKKKIKEAREYFLYLLKTDDKFKDKWFTSWKNTVSGNTIYTTKISNSLKEYYQNNVSHWVGRTHKEETKRKIGLANSGIKGPNGTCWITNGTENKKIRKEELDSYIQQGYYKGRKI